MKKRIVNGLTTIGLIFGAGTASAASLGLTTEAPSYSSSSAIVEFVDFGFGEGDLFSFGAIIDGFGGTAPADAENFDFSLAYSLADPTDAPGGGFFVTDAFFAPILSGDVVDVGFTTNTVEVLFGTLTGSGAAEFGAQVLLTILFDDALGANPFDNFEEFFPYGASLELASVADTAIIPLPAGLPLMLLAMGGLCGLRRKQGAA